MGMRNLSMIVEQLILHGRNPETPAAVIQQGTLGSQKVVEGTLDTICRIVNQHALKPPGIVVVGEVVKLRQELRWFETMPLFGRRVIITREYQEEDTLSDVLEENGAEIVLFPTISFQPPDSYEEADRALAQLGDFQWIIFTSSNGVRYFYGAGLEPGKRCEEVFLIFILPLSAAARSAPSRASISGRTSCRMNSALKAWCAHSPSAALPGRAFSFPGRRKRAMCLTRDCGPCRTRCRQCRFIKPWCRQRCSRPSSLPWCRIATALFLPAHRPCIISLSTATPAVLQELKDMAIACIGPITEGALRKHGFTARIVPLQYDFRSLAEAIINYYERVEELKRVAECRLPAAPKRQRGERNAELKS